MAFPVHGQGSPPSDPPRIGADVGPSGDGQGAAQARVDTFLDDAWSSTSETDISREVSLFESWAADRADEAGSPEEEAAYRRLVIDANSALIAHGPSDAHVQVGIRRQILFLQRHDDLPLEPALEPIFQRVEAGASPAVHSAVASAMQLRPAPTADHDPYYFIDRTLALLWDADTPELAELPVDILTALARERDFAEPIVERLAEQLPGHLDDWSVNAATEVVTYTGTLATLDHTPAREHAGVAMGLAFTSPALDMDYLGRHFARGGEKIATLDHNTVDGVIAVFTPTIFASPKPARYPFPLRSFLQPMLGRPAWLQRDADAMADWTAFLERVVALDDPDFSPTAREALAELR